jgi:hypothetical protein
MCRRRSRLSLTRCQSLHHGQPLLQPPSPHRDRHKRRRRGDIYPGARPTRSQAAAPPSRRCQPSQAAGAPIDAAAWSAHIGSDHLQDSEVIIVHHCARVLWRGLFSEYVGGKRPAAQRPARLAGSHGKLLGLASPQGGGRVWGEVEGGACAPSLPGQGRRFCAFGLQRWGGSRR